MRKRRRQKNGICDQHRDLHLYYLYFMFYGQPEEPTLEGTDLKVLHRLVW